MARKIEIDEEVYLLYYNRGMSDLQISKLLNISNSTLSRFRKSLDLPPNKRKEVVKNYKAIKETRKMEQLIIGTLLGDGSLELNKKTKAKNARYKAGHSNKQLEYIIHKHSVLGADICSNIIYTKNVAFNTISHPYFTKYYSEFYKNGKKVIPFDLLERMSSLGLAYLFMDDGSRDSKTNSYYLSLCSFELDEQKKFMQFLFNKFGIKTSLHAKGTKDNKYHHIYIKAESRNILIKLIEPYIIPSMKYKIGK